MASFQPAGFFLLRTPLLPFDQLTSWTPPADASDGLAISRRRLREVAARPEVHEALFLASPSLMESLPVWDQQPGSARAEKIEHTVDRYVARMASRPTPFGLFAGVSVGHSGPATTLDLGPGGDGRKHVRFDGGWLSQLSGTLAGQSAIAPSLRYRVNGTACRSAGRVRYVETRWIEGHPTYHLVAIDDNQGLQALLDGPPAARSLPELAQTIATACEAEFDEARAFVDELVASQFLVPMLDPPATGGGAVRHLAGTLEAIGQPDQASILAQGQAHLDQLGRSAPGLSPAAYELPPAVAEMAQGCQAKHVYQVDLYKPAPGLALGPRVMRAVQDGCNLLLGLSPREPDGLSGFRRAFRQRYEDQEVPLLQALDEEMGIGFPASDEPPVSSFTPGTARHDLMLARLHRAWSTGERNIDLTAAEIKTLQVREPNPPRSFAACLTLAAASAEAADAGDFLAYIEGLRGPTAGTVIGRFCNGSEQLTAQLRELGAKEQAAAGEAILAELVHVPSGRVGNVIARPLLRQYEIPLLARSGAAEADQIELSDLWLSVVGNRVVLRSRRLGREVIPTLSSAHSFMDSALVLYRFFGWLSTQSGGWAGWRWGCFGNAPFLPRISHGRIILQLARWRIDVAESGLTAARSRAELQAALDRLRAERGLPRFVSLEDGDSGFVIDLDNPVSAGTLADTARKHKVLVLSEAFPAADQLPVRGPEGRFVSELMVPFIREATPAPARTSPARAAIHTAAPIRRTFAPGSEWLYAKLYTGSATAEAVLEHVVAPLARWATSAPELQQWFFLRYGDPDWHIRVRFQGEPAWLRNELGRRLGQLTDEAMAAGIVRRVQFDTYQREIERYGGPAGVELAEAIFRADSDSLLGVLSDTSGDAGVDTRWRLTFRSVDAWLDGFGLDLDEKLRFIKGMAEGFPAEAAPGSTPLDRIVGDIFRKDRAKIAGYLDGSDPAVARFAETLAARQVALAPAVQALRERARAGHLSSSLTDLVGSFVHMHVNRLFRDGRSVEPLLYQLMYRAYDSAAARRTGAQKAEAGRGRKSQENPRDLSTPGPS